MALPTIHCHPTKGPLIKMESPDGNTVKLFAIDNNGKPTLGGKLLVVAITNQRLVATAAQTVFTLAVSLAGSYSRLFINGMAYSIAVDYTLSGTTLTWLDTDFPLEEGDVVEISHGI